MSYEDCKYPNILKTKYCESGVYEHDTNKALCLKGSSICPHEEHKGNKHDQEKIRTDLLPVRPLMAIAKVLTHGAKKYGDRNWEKGLKWSRPYGAILRHLFAWWNGQIIDKDSGEPHLACAATEILFLLEYSTQHKELDDRP